MAVRCEDIPVFHSLTEASMRRTRRLLISSSELEREARGSPESTNGSSQSKADISFFYPFLDDFGEEWWIIWNKTLERARKVQIPENDLTEEFREARRIGLEHDPLSDPHQVELQVS